MNYENNSEDLDSQFHEDYMKPLKRKKAFDRCPLTRSYKCPDGIESHNCMNCTRKQDMSMPAADWLIVILFFALCFAFFMILIYLLVLWTK